MWVFAAEQRFTYTSVCVCVFPSAVVYHTVWARPSWHRRTLHLPVPWIGARPEAAREELATQQGLGTRAHGAPSAARVAA